MADVGLRPSLNIITSVVESDCEDKWAILANTLLPAVTDTLWLILLPSPVQILQGFLKPLNRRHGGKGIQRVSKRWRESRMGQARERFRLGIPDLDSMIADTIPGRSIFKGRKAGIAESWLWTGIEVLDELQWYWLLIDAGDDLVTHWASGIMESRFCSSNTDALYTREAYNPLGDGNAAAYPQNWPTPTVNKGWYSLDNDIRREQGSASGIMSITLAITWLTSDSYPSRQRSIVMHGHWIDADGHSHNWQSTTGSLSGKGATTHISAAITLTRCTVITFSFGTTSGWHITISYQGELVLFCTADK